MKPIFKDIYIATLKALNVKPDIYEQAKKSRRGLIIMVKRTLCYVCRQVGFLSHETASYVGLDESSVRYHIGNAKKKLSIDSNYANLVDGILSQFGFSSKQYEYLGWLTRDTEEQGEYLYLTIGEKPIRDTFSKIWIVDEGMMIDLPKSAYPNITWENSPQECKMTLRLI